MNQGEERRLDVYIPELYEIGTIECAHGVEEYLEFLKAHYEPLGFMCGDVLPESDSILIGIRFKGRLAAIFRLTMVTDINSPYHRLIPNAIHRSGERKRLLEVNNVVIAREYRASAVLGLILYRSACEAHSRGYDFVVGLNRYQILRFFVDFGVIPVEAPPIHVLGKDHLSDFINYYDTADPNSIAYMHERAKRYFHQEYVMKSIHEKYVVPERRRLHSGREDVPQEGQLVHDVAQVA